MGKGRGFRKRFLGLLCAAVAYTVMTASVGLAQTDPEEDAPTRRNRTESASPIPLGKDLPLILLPDAPLNAGDGATPAPRDVTESPARLGNNLPLILLPDAPLNAGDGATPAPRDVTESPLRPGLPSLPLPDAPLDPANGGSDPTGGDFGNVVTIELVYSEKASEDQDDKVSDGCYIDSLISGVGCVVRAMDGPQAGGGGRASGDGPPAREKTFGARLSVPVKPVVLTVDAGKIYYLWFDVGAPRLHIPRGMPAESLRSARRDATFVLSRLKKWARALTGDIAAVFREQNRMTVRLIDPFEGLSKLRLVKPARVNFRIGPKPEIRLRFVRLEDERFVRLGGPAVHGQPFFLEALLENPEEDRFSYDVEVAWAGGGGEFVRVERSDNNRKLFRSKPIYLGYPK